MAEGNYNLILYVDDLEEVSELDEVNNKVLVRVPITIEAITSSLIASTNPNRKRQTKKSVVE